MKPSGREEVTREEAGAAVGMPQHAIGETHARTEFFADEAQRTRVELEERTRVAAGLAQVIAEQAEFADAVNIDNVFDVHDVEGVDDRVYGEVGGSSAHVQNEGNVTSSGNTPPGNVQGGSSENVINLINEDDGGDQWTRPSNMAHYFAEKYGRQQAGSADAPQVQRNKKGDNVPNQGNRNSVTDAARQTTPPENPAPHRVIVENPPKLPSGTKRAIVEVFQQCMRDMGYQPDGPHRSSVEAELAGEPEIVSIARNKFEGPARTQKFLFPDLARQSASQHRGQIFATAQWRPKEPPVYKGDVSDDVYLWTSLVRQYFVFMQGTPAQEVAFAATLLRGAAHEWYQNYEKRNGNRSPQNWATLQQALTERFGSNIRAQEALSKLISISQGKRSIREYTSEFETLLGRLNTQDESTWMNVYIWGLQPHLAMVVALKYPSTIAQAVRHAEAAELAIRASQRPGTGAGSGIQGARSAGVSSGRRGSRGKPHNIYQDKNRGRKQQRGRGRRNFQNKSGAQSGWNQNRQIICHRCGKPGKFASKCTVPREISDRNGGTVNSAGSVNQRTNQGAWIGQRSNQNQWGADGNNRRGAKRIRFSSLNVVYDSQGNEYPVDDYGKLVITTDDFEDLPPQNQTNLQGN